MLESTATFGVAVFGNETGEHCGDRIERNATGSPVKQAIDLAGIGFRG